MEHSSTTSRSTFVTSTLRSFSLVGRASLAKQNGAFHVAYLIELYHGFYHNVFPPTDTFYLSPFYFSNCHHKHHHENRQ